jgi:hypothetical protein
MVLQLNPASAAANQNQSRQFLNLPVDNKRKISLFSGVPIGTNLIAYKKNQQQDSEGEVDSINLEQAKANFENRYRLLESQLKNSMANSNNPGGPTPRKVDQFV